MGIPEKLEDARVLFSEGRHEGAFLSLLVAVAGTSRKRYSKGGDADAFKRFVKDQMPYIVQRFVKVTLLFRGKPRELEVILYKYARCALLHEGKLPADVVLSADENALIKMDKGRFTVPLRMFFGLSWAVVHAPENSGLFPNGNPLLAVMPESWKKPKVQEDAL